MSACEDRGAADDSSPTCVAAPALTPARDGAARDVNLFGDRHIEWSWVAAHIGEGPGEALDFGPGESWISLVAVRRGYRVTTVDLETAPRPYVEPDLHSVQGDLLCTPLPESHFDLVINCSSVEHVGLSGRYGVQTDNGDTAGDLRAMQKLSEVMKSGATMILTIPVGRDAVFAPMCRVYGRRRLPRLLRLFEITREAYWVKDESNRWVACDRSEALAFEADAGADDWRQNVYGLGCFVLRKGTGDG